MLMSVMAIPSRESADESGLALVADLRDLSERLVAGDGAALDEEEAAELSGLMHAMRATIDSELSGVSAFVVSDKRSTSDKLLHNISLLFRQEPLPPFPRSLGPTLRRPGSASRLNVRRPQHST